MVLVSKLNSCACNIHAWQLTAAFMDQQHRRTLLLLLSYETLQQRSSGTNVTVRVN